MAEAHLLISEEEFTCSVCLDTLTDPVSTPCGHSFCLECLKGFWDHSQVFICPQCRRTYVPRPELQRNTLLNEVIKKLKKNSLDSPPLSQNYVRPGDIQCDACTERKFRAVKSCLTCMASFCQVHLQPHYEGAAWKDHKLTDPGGNLKDKLCAKHQKGLEVFCQTNNLCICMICVATEHRGHHIVELKTAREEKQNELGRTLSEIQSRIGVREKKVEETRKVVEQIKVSAKREVKESEKSFIALIRCIEETCKKVTEKINKQKKQEMKKAEDLMLCLEKEIKELKSKEAALKELLQTDDNIHFLQTFSPFCGLPKEGDSLSFTITADFSSEDLRRKLPPLKEHLEKFSQWEVVSFTPPGRRAPVFSLQPPPPQSRDAFLQSREAPIVAPQAPKSQSREKVLRCREAPVFPLQPPEPQRRDEFLQYFCPLTLDINTANRDLRLSEGNKKVTRERTETRYFKYPDRFDWWAQALCREALTGSRCYWEIQWSGENVEIGVAYKGMSRKGDGVYRFGFNDKSWSLLWSDSQYSVYHNSQQTVLSAPYSPRIGVYLDWPAGCVSFYSVSHKMTLLHRFNTSFTEPLTRGLDSVGTPV
uniref:Uncharacterized protein n=1 Tax=Erpetoichthys calabaricus TaxID=27687 RepID=A0A8C4TKZ6_ERPCA